MTRTPGDPGQPKRPKPTRREPPPPEPEPDPDLLGPQESTWQPAMEPARHRKPRERTEPARAGGGPTYLERLVFGSVSTAHLAQFCRQFAAYLDAGVAIVRSLASLKEQFARTALGPVIDRLELAVRRGQALAEAMAREPQAFDAMMLSMMRVAEARGGVPETLRRLAEHYDARLRLFRQARSALIYPVTVLLVAAGVIALLTMFVLPVYVSLLRDLAGRGEGPSLPLPTRFLIGLSDFMSTLGWWLVPLALIGGAFTIRYLYRTPAGRGAMDEAIWYVPVFGQLLRKIDMARFARSLAALLDGGVDIGASLELATAVVHLTPYRRALRGVKSNVMEGSELSEALRETERFTPDIIAVVNSGEETGKLPETLDHLADDYEEQVTYMVKNLSTLVQPLVMFVLGFFVLVIILAVVLPYISMISALTR